MNLLLLEWAIQWAGALLALTTLALVFVGIWRGVGRAPGRAVGRGTGWLRSPLFYLIVSSFYIALSVILWRPLPVSVSTAARGWALLIGSLIYFPGMLLTLWGRLALGGMYFVSTGFGAQLYAGHRLITHGPYAIVRHPMYAGLIAAAIGSLLIYRTWTALIFAACRAVSDAASPSRRTGVGDRVW